MMTASDRAISALVKLRPNGVGMSDRPLPSIPVTTGAPQMNGNSSPWAGPIRCNSPINRFYFKLSAFPKNTDAIWRAIYTLNLNQWKYLRFSEYSLNLRRSLIQNYSATMLSEISSFPLPPYWQTYSRYIGAWRNFYTFLTRKRLKIT